MSRLRIASFQVYWFFLLDQAPSVLLSQQQRQKLIGP